MDSLNRLIVLGAVNRSRALCSLSDGCVQMAGLERMYLAHILKIKILALG
jgi:hypothetical protein